MISQENYKSSWINLLIASRFQLSICCHNKIWEHGDNQIICRTMKKWYNCKHARLLDKVQKLNLQVQHSCICARTTYILSTASYSTYNGGSPRYSEIYISAWRKGESSKTPFAYLEWKDGITSKGNVQGGAAKHVLWINPSSAA